MPAGLSHEQILEEALAALTEDNIPPDDAGRAWADPDTGRPAEFAGLSGAELDELLAAAVPASSPWRTEPSWPVPTTASAVSAGAASPGAASAGPACSGAVRAGEELPGGWLPRDGSGAGSGFGDGGELDVLAAGLPLAGFAEDTHRALTQVSDDVLVGVLRAWRRVSCWAAARELAAAAELARRRPAPGEPPAPAGRVPVNLSEFVPDELAAALTLTYRAAQDEAGLAVDLAGPLAPTAAALAAGRIDLARTRLIATAARTLTDAHAAAVQAAVLPGAPDLTTGQLRRALARAVLAADPDAARRQREEAVTDARVDCYPDPAGSATLAGRNLPAASALAADKRLCVVAKTWKHLGATGGMDLLRARAYLALLLGLDVTSPPADLLPPPDPRSDTPPGPRRAGPPGPGRDQDRPGQAGQDRQDLPAGLRPSGTGPGPSGTGPGPSGTGPGPSGTGPGSLAGSVNLTIPLATLMGLSDMPGAAAGYGPLDPETARALACAAAGHRATRWHITVTGPAGRVLGHGATTNRTPANDDGSGWSVRVTAEPIAAGTCDHRTSEDGYRPSPALQEIIRARGQTCTAPGCGRPAGSCDLDHTIPHDQDGITCECNLAALCRRHHRMKQDQGWTLEQPCPGVMAWLTPAGRRYITIPSQHPT